MCGRETSQNHVTSQRLKVRFSQVVHLHIAQRLQITRLTDIHQRLFSCKRSNLSLHGNVTNVIRIHGSNGADKPIFSEFISYNCDDNNPAYQLHQNLLFLPNILMQFYIRIRLQVYIVCMEQSEHPHRHEYLCQMGGINLWLKHEITAASHQLLRYFTIITTQVECTSQQS